MFVNYIYKIKKYLLQYSIITFFRIYYNNIFLYIKEICYMLRLREVVDLRNYPIIYGF